MDDVREQRARAAAAAAAAAAEATEGVVWLLARDGALAGESPSWCAFTGQTPDEARGRAWLDAIHPDEREAATAELDAAHAEERGYEIEVRLRRPTARYTRARVRGVPVRDPDDAVAHWVVTLREVWTDESVRRSEERLRLATAAAHVAVWEYDFLAGQMTRTDNHDALYGIPPGGVWTYDVFTNATHPDDRATADATVQRACAPGGPDDYAFDFRVVWPDGAVRWLNCTGHVTARDAAGRATLVRGALIDVTRLKRVEAELRDAVRARDEFIQVASHELNTPLTPLTLELGRLARLAGEEKLRTADVQRHVDSARRQVKRLAVLVENLLDVTRLAQGRLALATREVSLAELVTSVTEQLGLEAARRGCELRVVVTRDAVGRWDRDRLEQVVQNLVGNALKYGDRKPVRVEVGREGDRARIVVRDEGIGIDPESIGRIFAKFERAAAARSFGGLGLGLYIVKEIVDGHGGSVSVTSEPGRGSTFVVELPIAQG